LQISTPQREEVAAYDQYRFNPRDEIAVAINNFVELLQSDEVYRRTITELGLNEIDSIYTVDAVRASDADFVNVTVEARDPELAAEIANTHISITIAYYGELRSQSTRAEQALFGEQLREAQEELGMAEKALADFRTQHGIYSLESQMSTQQRLIEQLQLERDQLLLQQAATVITATQSAATITVPAATPIPTIDLIAEVDKLIVQRMKELEKYTALAPQYHLLEQSVAQTRAVYENLLSKYTNAELTATAVQSASFIQVIKPAFARAESNWPKLAALALAGSLGLGVMLAFLLQYLSGPETSPAHAPASDHKSRSRRHRKAGVQEHGSKEHESDHKVPALGHAIQEFWKRIQATLHRLVPVHKPANLATATSFDQEQESVVVPEQHDPAVGKAA
jgi:uncharacterized protein involved in exopolysaccharide biosynthesis